MAHWPANIILFAASRNTMKNTDKSEAFLFSRNILAVLSYE